MSLGFYFDMQRCIGCRVCQIACKDRFGLELAGARMRRVETYEGGTFPKAAMYNTSIACNHCENPACVATCPTGAMFKAEDGTVQHDDEACIKCQTCVNSCPYGAPQVADELDGLIVKCDSCKALRDANQNPVCVNACVMRALDFGEIDDLKAKYGTDLVSEVPCMPSSDTTNPNIVIKARPAGLEAEFAQIIL
ncbi:4Fe-4S dicluster domain-containing protein [Slackia heliotrinireducens]|uniref:4Fe-4S dicluster domain-containing protein n=1 Tax=Slackia heliotrinireducens TaxID=84110 RepID=UPI0033149A28